MRGGEATGPGGERTQVRTAGSGRDERRGAEEGVPGMGLGTGGKRMALVARVLLAQEERDRE